MVEQQPSKLMTRVRFPSPAFGGVSGWWLVFRFEGEAVDLQVLAVGRFYLWLTANSLRLYCCCSSVVEHFLGKEEVMSSSLISSSEERRRDS